MTQQECAKQLKAIYVQIAKLTEEIYYERWDDDGTTPCLIREELRNAHTIVVAAFEMANTNELGMSYSEPEDDDEKARDAADFAD